MSLLPLGGVLGGCGGDSAPPGERAFLDACDASEELCKCALRNIKQFGYNDSRIADYAEEIADRGGAVGEGWFEGCDD